MRRWQGFAAAVAVVLATVAGAEDGAKAPEARDASDKAAKPEGKAAETQAAPRSADSQTPVWSPRDAGAPLTRVGGATRSMATDSLPTIRALVPERMGYTLDAQPVLYWQLSEATDRRVDFTLVAKGKPAPVVEQTLEGPLGKGLQRIDLARYGVHLEPGVSYMWYVSIVPDPERRSEDRVTGGAIERLAASPQLEAARERGDVATLASEGIWYDALESLSDRADSDPRARSDREALLEQVGLSLR